MHRFFVEPTLLAQIERGQYLMLPQKLAHQVRDVLKLAVDEQLILLDNSGEEVVAALARSSRAEVEVRIVERRSGRPEAAVHVILCQGLLKSARFEWILEKGTELGVSVFAPILCRRSMPGLEEAGPAKVQRWQRIIQEAAEQCGRARLPELLPARPLPHALSAIAPDALAIMPWEEEHGQSLRHVLRNAQSRTTDDLDAQSPMTVMLFIGPEGGLMSEEVMLAKQHGVHIVTLGTSILRAETAALVTVANVLYELA